MIKGHIIEQIKRDLCSNGLYGNNFSKNGKQFLTIHRRDSDIMTMDDYNKIQSIIEMKNGIMSIRVVTRRVVADYELIEPIEFEVM